MNRTDQKLLIKDIIITIGDVKSNLKNKKADIQRALTLAEQLNDTLLDLNVYVFDLEDFTDKLNTEAIHEELTPIYDEIHNFKFELDDYISELSESKAQKLEERYETLEEVLEKLDELQEYETIDDSLDHIDEIVDMLKEML